MFYILICNYIGLVSMTNQHIEVEKLKWAHANDPKYACSWIPQRDYLFIDPRAYLWVNSFAEATRGPTATP